MIFEAEQALAAVFKARVIRDSALGIAFDPPNKAWAQAVKKPVVNFFLFDIRENPHLRDVMYEPVRNAQGSVVAHRPPPPRFDLHYTVSVWAPTIVMEHKILAATLRCFSGMEALPAEALPPALAALPYQVLVNTGAGNKRAMFLNLGGELKSGFELELTVPMPSITDLVAAPTVQASPNLNLKPVPDADPARTAQATETVGGVRPTQQQGVKA
ncbi:MAG TPA: Pvc16 family protein [Pseudonocardiaceae bacterium]|jgi:hypothetical protein